MRVFYDEELQSRGHLMRVPYCWQTTMHSMIALNPDLCVRGKNLLSLWAERSL